jgi:hypothetical protein
MSTEQLNIGASIERKTTEKRKEALRRFKGAAYRHDSKPAETVPADAGCCKNCGRDVRADPEVQSTAIRMYGDEYDRLPACDGKDCIKPRDGTPDTFTTITQAINAWRREQGGL